MRASELIDAVVVDEAGEVVGRVHDLRVIRREGTFRITGLAVAGARLAHAWGFAEGRATGPWLLRVLTARSARAARFVSADQVLDWGPDTVRIRGRRSRLPALAEQRQP